MLCFEIRLKIIETQRCCCDETPSAECADRCGSPKAQLPLFCVWFFSIPAPPPPVSHVIHSEIAAQNGRREQGIALFLSVARSNPCFVI